MKVAVLATSYPRSPADPAGTFVASGVAALRGAGVETAVVSPADFEHFGIAFGHGIVQNLRARPWLVPLVPAFLASFALAARRAARDADLVHAHWIPSGLAALATRKPYVLQVWGTDVELARGAPALARPVVARAAAVVAASSYLAEAATALGARDVRVIPAPLEVPSAPSAPADPPHVLFVGRLSEEKGILDLLEATEGLPRVIVGDGPLRARVPESVGALPPAAVGDYYSRASVVCVPSRREGYGMTAREAAARGRPVVASAVGGLVDAVEDGVTGLLVPPRDPAALRAALVRLLADAGLRDRLGATARERAARLYAPEAVAAETLALYRDVVR